MRTLREAIYRHDECPTEDELARLFLALDDATPDTCGPAYAHLALAVSRLEGWANAIAGALGAINTADLFRLIDQHDQQARAEVAA